MMPHYVEAANKDGLSIKELDDLGSQQQMTKGMLIMAKLSVFPDDVKIIVDKGLAGKVSDILKERMTADEDARRKNGEGEEDEEVAEVEEVSNDDTVVDSPPTTDPNNEVDPKTNPNDADPAVRNKIGLGEEAKTAVLKDLKNDNGELTPKGVTLKNLETDGERTAFLADMFWARSPFKTGGNSPDYSSGLTPAVFWKTVSDVAADVLKELELVETQVVPEL